MGQARVLEHVSGVAAPPSVQLNPLSTRHAGEQPSPAKVLLSSHCSGAERRPSPQSTGAAQNLALVLATVNVVPGYAALHVLWLAAGLVGVAVE